MDKIPDLSDFASADEVEPVGDCMVCGNSIMPYEKHYFMDNLDIVHEEHFLEYAIEELGAELHGGDD